VTTFVTLPVEPAIICVCVSVYVLCVYRETFSHPHTHTFEHTVTDKHTRSHTHTHTLPLTETPGRAGFFGQADFSQMTNKTSVFFSQEKKMLCIQQKDAVYWPKKMLCVQAKDVVRSSKRCCVLQTLCIKDVVY